MGGGELITAQCPPLPAPFLLPTPPTHPQHSSMGILLPKLGPPLSEMSWAAAEATVAVAGRGRDSRCKLVKGDSTSNRPRNRVQNPRPTRGQSTVFPAAREMRATLRGCRWSPRTATCPCSLLVFPVQLCSSCELDSLSCALTPFPYSCSNRAFHSLCSDALMSWGPDPERLPLPWLSNS